MAVAVRKRHRKPYIENGTPMPYQRLDKTQAKNIKSIRGIFKMWQKAPKYVLRVDATNVKLYVSVDHTLTKDRKQAQQFAKGFDNPEIKRMFWSGRFNLKFITENL